ncbi:MAG: helix-turn-helix transcriptional regulator, partial [Caloramator sp.]|nr:helix-turn-helix transcriptional regulator [Caloramator sp.]
KGITQLELANILGITPQNISYYEKGREPNYEILSKLADYFGVTTDYLIGKSDFRTWEEERNAVNYGSLLKKAENNTELKIMILDSINQFLELLDLLFYTKNIEENKELKKKLFYENHKIINHIAMKLHSFRVIFIANDNIDKKIKLYQKSKHDIIRAIDKLLINFLIEDNHFNDKDIQIQSIDDKDDE